MLNKLRELLAQSISVYEEQGKDAPLLNRSVYLLFLDATNFDNILDVNEINNVKDYDSAPELRAKAIECLITGARIDMPITVFMPNPYTPSSCSFISAYGSLYMVWQGALMEALDKLASNYGKLEFNFTVSSIPDHSIVRCSDVYDLLSEFTYA